MKELVQAIKGLDDFLICMHVDPDGDTIGSACALSLALQKLGKTSTIYSPDPVPAMYSFIKNSQNTLRSPEKTGKRFGAVIALDCADLKRIEAGHKIKDLGGTLINIDHHEDNTLFGDLNLVRNVSSTGEIVYDLIKELGVEVDEQIAQAVYVAMITDTGSFRFSNTSERVFAIAAELVKCGIDVSAIATSLYDSRSEGELRALAASLNRIERYCGGKIAVSYLSDREIASFGVVSQEMQGIVDYLRSIRDVEIAVFLRQTQDGRVKINFRSKTFDIQQIAKALGGGGHKRASGAVLDGPLDEAKKKAIGTIEAIWTASSR